MPLVALNPPIRIIEGKVAFDAVDAGRTARGIAATVQVVLDDAVRDVRTVRLGDVEKRRKAAAEIAAVGGLSPEEVDAALVKLAAAIETELRASRNTPPPPTAEILDAAPEGIHRPLCIVKDRTYAAAWLWSRAVPAQSAGGADASTPVGAPARGQQALIIVRNDGALFTDAPIRGVQPLSALGLTVRLAEVPPADRTWSGAGVKRFVEGNRPDPADVFEQVVGVVDYFMDFARSLAPQRTMCEFVACYVFASYFLDAFYVAGYLWTSGDSGAGKTECLITVTELAYLGLVIVAGGSYASLRDLADYGATLAFDDAEAIANGRRIDPGKQTLLLAGNRRGITVPVKEPDGPRSWRTRYVDAFCSRLFSAIHLPHRVLGSRSIAIPLVRTHDKEKADRDPTNHPIWPHDRRRLIDDLWAVGLVNLSRVRSYDAKAAAQARLTGRSLDPWRAVCAVSLWLQEEHGVKNLFLRMEPLSVAYQHHRSDLEVRDATRVAISTLLRMAAAYVDDPMIFTPSLLAELMNYVAREWGITEVDEDFTNPKRVGRLLKRLRLREAPRASSGKRWQVTREELASIAQAYGMARRPVENGTNGTGGDPGFDEMPRDSEGAVS